jgi:hypothetical protein
MAIPNAFTVLAALETITLAAVLFFKLRHR